MSDVIAEIAKNIAEELEPLFDAMLGESDLRERAKIERKIERVLWDNKAGIVRVCQDRSGHR